MTIDPAGEVARIEAERAKLPADERLRLEAGDAPLLRIQLLHMLERAKKAEAAIRRVRALHQPIHHMGKPWCTECSHRRSTGPKTYEWVAYIPHPCPTIDAIEETQ
ncbi:hypothetical protein [Streptomyces sp. NPDC048611]|uniref:hypothetical protein n=1 Tax=Streptomyces sp. NPDC048611 TaxID=3155635 RepID=UPI003420214D